MKRWAAMGLVLVMLLLCTACGGGETPADATTSGAIQTSAQDSTDPEPATEGTADTNETTNPEDSSATTAPQGSTAEDLSMQAAAPQGKAEILRLYNNALAASKQLQRSQYKRSLVRGGLWRNSEPEAVLDLAKEDGMHALVGASNTQKSPSDLTALTDIQVKSASCTAQGGKYTVTLQLNDAAQHNLNSPALAGYVGIATQDICKVLIKDIANSMYGIGAVSVSSSTTALTGGRIIAVISEAGKIESVNYSASQTFNADLRILLAIGAGLTITFDLQAEYK